MTAFETTINEVLGELLYEQQCVIIPNFGALVGNRVSAQLNESKNTFYPPYKKIVFNAQLQMNDGLLIQSLSVKTNDSFNNVKTLLDNTIKYWQKELHQGKSVQLEKIGEFKKVRGNIEFYQDLSVNYLPEAFGFKAIHVSVVQRESIKEKIAQRIIEQSIPNAKAKGYKWQQLAAAVLVPMVGASALFLTLNASHNKVTQMDWNPFSFKKEMATKKPKPTPNVDVVITIANAETNLNSGKQQELIEKYTTLPNDSTKVVLENSPKITTQTTSSHLFHVVAGCFASEENALAYLQEIKLAGFNGQVIGKTSAGLTRVAYGSYTSKEQALEGLEIARQKHSKDAWIVEQ